MELRFIVFLHITNFSVHIKNTRLYTANKGEGATESTEKSTESIYNTDQRAHTLCCCFTDQAADQCNDSNTYSTMTPNDIYTTTVTTTLAKIHFVQPCKKKRLRCHQIRLSSEFIIEMSWCDVESLRTQWSRNYR